MFSRCEFYCPVCRQQFDWMRGYGKDIRCCGRECHVEAEWRRTLAILGKEYYHDPRLTHASDTDADHPS